jgi:peptide/nickel transport system substrate-binding protein
MRNSSWRSSLFVLLGMGCLLKAGAADLTMANGAPKGKYPGQYEATEFQKLSGKRLVYKGNPLFKNLDSVEKRLPQEPLVVVPEKEIGKYGGTLLMTSKAPESGTSGCLSLRHVNWVRFDGDLKTIVPDVASEFSYNKAHTELTFKIRKGMRWSDGEPFTADDVLFWYKDIKLNKTLYQGDPLPYQIVKVDDCTVKYVFAEPNTSMLINLASCNGYVQPWQPKHFLKKFHIDYNPDADKLAKDQGYPSWKELFYAYYNDWKDSYHKVGVPTIESHVLVEETTDYRLFKANPYYFKVDTAGQQLPYIDEIRESFVPDSEVQNLKVIAGEVDLVGQNLAISDYPLLKKNEKPGHYAALLPPVGVGAASVYIFNITHKDPVKRQVFSNVKFKQAMSLAMDRNEINERVYLGQGRPIAGLPADPLSVPFVTADQAKYMTEYGPERANKLLDEIGLKKRDGEGFRLGPDGKRFAIDLEYAQQGGPQLIHELVKSYWEKVGIRVDVKEVSSEVFRQRTVTNDHDVYTWLNDATSFPSIAGDPIVMYPPWSTNYQRRTGGPWVDYWNSKGASGEKPPAYIQSWHDLGVKMRSMEVGSKEWSDTGKSLVQKNLDNMIYIGTVGYVPALAIVNNRVKNVPAITTMVWDYYYFYPYKPDQFFLGD